MHLRMFFSYYIFLLFSTFFGKYLAVEFQILNREIGDIWVGIQGNPGHPHLNEGGFVLTPGQQVSIQVPSNWAGRFWPRTWCFKDTNHCDTGDCGNTIKCNGASGNPPASVVEITLKGHEGLDFYDVSLVDGFNIEAAIEPIGGQSNDNDGQYSCKKAACQVRLNDNCPKELQLKNGNIVVGCNSACTVFKTDQYCCHKSFNRPEMCKPSNWQVNYTQYFKSHCPDAYSYAYDDKKNTFTCKSEKYLITFGG